ncbi:MAG TPA: pitrilysin family protein [Cyclobacteriaceae bacterium]|nr:pitrilysin family protein [Cyclobacteriaceae bacterium]
MISFDSFTLDNGLRVLVHEDPSVQIAVMNILYDVGSRDEQEHKTGFAHLFEHLMFGGSANVPSYDEPLQLVGGENNAFTSTDITNYYLTVPAQNIETGFWLESDRMLSLSFNPKVLEVQRKVVVEEFKQRYLNQPYGDVWLKLRPLAYKQHPYKWATIGKEVAHIEEATMEDVKDFFYKFYAPNNAIMVLAGNVKLEEVKRLAEKWFGPIEKRATPTRKLPLEHKQTAKRTLEVEANVPANVIYKTFHMPGRFDDNYYAADLLSDVLGRGNSSRLYQTLVNEKKLFTGIQSYVTGSIDPGLLVISGRMAEGVSFKDAEASIDEIITELKAKGPSAEEEEKVKNQVISTLVFDEVEVLHRAMNLAYFALSGDFNRANKETERFNSVSAAEIKNMANDILTEENASVMYYKSKLN